MSTIKYPAELKMRVAESYLAGEGSYKELRERYGVSEKSVQLWAQKNREHGRTAFVWETGNAHYSKEFKMMCVETVLQGKNNVADLIREYDEQYNHIIFGYRRMTLWINRLNAAHFSKNRVQWIMKAIGVHSVIRRQPRKYKKSTPERVAENVLKRDFNASKPNEK